MKKTLAVVFAVIVVGLVTLTTVILLGQRGIYRPDEVEFLAEGATPEGPRIMFQPPLEDTHHCPGARYTIKGTAIHYELVRAPNGSDITVDAESVERQDGSLCITFPYPAGHWRKGDVYQLVNSAGESHGLCKNLGYRDAEQGAVADGDKPSPLSADVRP